MISLNNNLIQVKEKIYDPCDFELTNFIQEIESTEYDACQFQLNGKTIISRTSKITPKKVGQFVTFWKRIPSGIIAPFEASDTFDFFVVNTKIDNTKAIRIN